MRSLRNFSEAFIVWNVCRTHSESRRYGIPSAGGSACALLPIENPITVEIVRHRLMHFVVRPMRMMRRKERKCAPLRHTRSHTRAPARTHMRADRISTANQLSDDVGRAQLFSVFSWANNEKGSEKKNANSVHVLFCV